MKLLLSLIIMSLWQTVNAAGTKYKDYLVEKQPDAYAVLLENSHSVTTPMFNSWRFNAYPILFHNDADGFSGLGFGYAQRQYDTFQVMNLSSSYVSSHLTYYRTDKLSSNQYLESFTSAESNSTKEGLWGTNSLGYTLGGSYGYIASRQKIYKAGFIFSQQAGRSYLLPLLGFSYSHAATVIDMLLPFYVNMRWIAHRNFHALLVLDYVAHSYYDDQADDILQASQFRSSLALEYRLYRPIWLSAALDGAWGESLVLGRTSLAHSGLTANGLFRLGLITRF